MSAENGSLRYVRRFYREIMSEEYSREKKLALSAHLKKF
jgi:hypothetical protein